MLNCTLFPYPRPDRYEVEVAETAFCCGGLLKPCTTPGCTECGTHFQPLEHGLDGGTRSWCLPSHARCTGNKERVTCEVCRRRLGLEPLPTCAGWKDLCKFDLTGILSSHEWWRLQKQESIAWDHKPTNATFSLVSRGDGCEAHAHQDGTVEVFRAGHPIARGKWGKNGLGRVDGVVSGIEPCHPELLADLEHLIRIDGNGPIENDCFVCKKCGGEANEVYGVREGGGVGPVYICKNQNCTS